MQSFVFAGIETVEVRVIDTRPRCATCGDFIGGLRKAKRFCSHACAGAAKRRERQPRRWKADGLCTGCGAVPEPPYETCAACRAKNRARRPPTGRRVGRPPGARNDVVRR